MGMGKGEGERWRTRAAVTGLQAGRRRVRGEEEVYLRKDEVDAKRDRATSEGRWWWRGVLEAHKQKQ